MGIEINRDPNTMFYNLMKKTDGLTMEDVEFKRLYAMTNAQDRFEQ